MVTSVEAFVSLILVALASEVASLNLNDACTNPNGQAGRCINYRECQSILTLGIKKVLLAQEKTFIRQSQCGRGTTGALVCCADRSVSSRTSSKATLPKPPNCGVDSSNQYPWNGMVRYSNTGGAERIELHCGATLINSRYVLMAAGCYVGMPPQWNITSVRLGHRELNATTDKQDGEPVEMEIEKVIVHENYRRLDASQYDDIALIRFTRDVPFSNSISPICLPVDTEYRNRNLVGTRGIAVGWGRGDSTGPRNYKRKAELLVKDLQDCSNTYRREGAVLKDTQVCAAGAQGEKLCRTGGTMSILVKGSNFLYGIPNLQPYNCEKAVPEVFTNVAKYIEWIESKLE